VDLDAEQTLLKAIERHQGGFFEEAENLYRSILAAYPDHPDANHNLGVLATGVKQPVAALPFLKKAIQINPAIPQFWLSYIDALLSASRLEEARDILEQATSILTDEQRLRIEMRLCGPQADGQTTVESASRQTKVAGEQENRQCVKTYDDDAFPKYGCDTADATTPSATSGEINSLLSLYFSGNFLEARKAAEDFTQKYPDDPSGWKIKGNILAELADDLNAIEAFKRAILISPVDRELFYNMGISYYTLDLFGEAEINFRKAISIDPLYAEAHNNLGNTLKASGLLQKAQRSYEEAIRLNPHMIEASNNLGLVMNSLGKFAEAETIHRQSIESGIYDASTYNNLGLVLKAQDRLDEAEEAFNKSMQLDPMFSDAGINLSSCKMMRGELSEAAEVLKYVIIYHGNCPQALNNLGVLMADTGFLSDAAKLFRAAIDIKSNYVNAYNNLGYVYLSSGDLKAAETSYREALRSDRNNRIVSSNLVFMQNYKPEATPEDIKRHAAEFNEGLKNIQDHGCFQPKSELSSNKLRVGFVSGDFFSHPVGYFFAGLIASLNLDRFEIFIFYNNNKFDKITNVIRSNVTGWQDVYCMSDHDLAHQIQSMNICILVDLSGHTDKNRLPIFSRKVAPVQISWLGYCGTTGLPEIDYIIGDPYVTPRHEEHHFVEKIWRLPETYWCFAPPEDDLAVSELPAEKNNYITFGCFNNISKINDEVIRVWATIINACGNSKIFLKTRQFADQSVEKKICEKFSSFGVEADRLVIEGQSSRYDYLRTYNRIDIALDPFPFPGGATSIEGLWMGVPFLTKKGDRFYSHNGETILHNIGLPEWIADNEYDYVEKAIRFSKETDFLAILRKRLRAQILASPLFDSERFAANFEKAMLDIWSKYCSEAREQTRQSQTLTTKAGREF
jgi:predicted O-linked N-acetylglucosamine transferase (SPINDLY family)